jgi:hypothetical protein
MFTRRLFSTTRNARKAAAKKASSTQSRSSGFIKAKLPEPPVRHKQGGTISAYFTGTAVVLSSMLAGAASVHFFMRPDMALPEVIVDESEDADL